MFQTAGHSNMSLNQVSSRGTFGRLRRNGTLAGIGGVGTSISLESSSTAALACAGSAPANTITSIATMSIRVRASDAGLQPGRDGTLRPEFEPARAGKALAHRRKGVTVRFRPSGHNPFGEDSGEPVPNELRIGIDGPEDIAFHLNGSVPGSPSRRAPLLLGGEPPASDLPPYARVLSAVLAGDNKLSVGRDEAELAWRTVTPILDAWAEGRVPLKDYPAGSAGP